MSATANVADLQTELEALRRRLAELEPGFDAHSMELLRCVLANAPDVIAMAAPDGTILFLNRVQNAVPYEAVLGTNIFDYAAPGKAAEYRERIDGVLRTGLPETIEVDARLASGTLAQLEVRVGPILDGGKVIALTFIATDVTARRRDALALLASEAKLRMAVDSAGIGLWSWDPASDVVLWEDTLCTIFGFPPGQPPKGRTAYLQLVHPDDRARRAEIIARGVQEGRWEDEYRIVRPDGAVRWVMAKGTVIHDGGRAVVHGAVIDVTERRLRDEQLRQSQKLEAVGQLTAGIAHNFNNLLMGVLPNLDLAARKAPTDLVPLLRSAEQAALRAAELVRQLMTYAGRSRATTRAVEPIGLLVERTVALCRTTFDKRIAFDARYDARARARVDATQIEQSLLNLLINARDAVLDASVESPRIRVDVELVPADAPDVRERGGERAHVRIAVTDNGVGMDAATLAHIYEPFFTTKDVGRGTGLGLATAQAIVREHGGWMTCASEAGRGTTFGIYLLHEAGVKRGSVPSPAAPEAGGTEDVLVVDDEPAVRDVVSRMLDAAGYRAKCAASGPEALTMLTDPSAARRVALILLDVSMPGMPGRELRERLRELAPEARVVYFTGYAYEAADADDAVLQKPVTQTRLLSTVREVLDRRASKP
jgi:PAS domain S-box-containing protein